MIMFGSTKNKRIFAVNKKKYTADQALNLAIKKLNKNFKIASDQVYKINEGIAVYGFNITPLGHKLNGWHLTNKETKNSIKVWYVEVDIL